jgi:hypothetical protein
MIGPPRWLLVASALLIAGCGGTTTPPRVLVHLHVFDVHPTPNKIHFKPRLTGGVQLIVCPAHPTTARERRHCLAAASNVIRLQEMVSCHATHPCPRFLHFVARTKVDERFWAIYLHGAPRHTKTAG